MATYKVIQDIEAEDKLLGPFGLRQFIYLIIVAVSLFIGFKLSAISPLMILPLLPHTIFFAVLALPVGGEQPTETWLLAKVRFFVKPRRRIWDQTGQLNQVTITAPKKIEKVLTNNLSQGEVMSRLEALANTIDSRGWAVKNVNVNLFSQPTFAVAGNSSERLLDAGAVATPNPTFGVTAGDDILDTQNNPTAQNLDRMITASSKAHREKAINNMHHPDPTKVPIINDSSLHPFRNITYGATDSSGGDGSASAPAPTDPTQDNTAATDPDYWFLNDTPAPQKPNEATFENSVIRPDPSLVKEKSEARQAKQQKPEPLTEEELLAKIHEEKKHQPHSYGNLKVIKPIEEQEAEAKNAKREDANASASDDQSSTDYLSIGFTPTFANPLDDPINNIPPTSDPTAQDDTSVTQTVDPGIIELANNDDLNVATIARQAQKTKEKDLPDDGEVVINLH